jgi:hypothetical protein
VCGKNERDGYFANVEGSEAGEMVAGERFVHSIPEFRASCELLPNLMEWVVNDTIKAIVTV